MSSCFTRRAPSILYPPSSILHYNPLMANDTYISPLASRNASPDMLPLFSPDHKFSLWRRLWLELAKAQYDLGLKRITPEALKQMEQSIDKIDFEKAADWEKRLRHDVMAHIHTFEEAAPAAAGIIHLGATSQYVVDNADLMIMRDAMQLLTHRLAAIIDSLGTFAEKWKNQPTLAYTHFQPAQLTTVGKRACLWAQDFLLDLEELESRISTLKFRGVKGTTGTQASFLTLFDNDEKKVEELDKRVTAACGFAQSYPVTGQTYPRKIDAQILSSLANMGASVHKFANDVRLLAGLKQLEEPFEDQQVGSSAMAYKRNPMLSERATGLSRFLISLSLNPLQTAAEQWFERTLDDSSNKRIVIPEAFLAADGALLLIQRIVAGLVVYAQTISRSIQAELPFMATEEILMEATRLGGSRQDLHERLRQHSQAAAEKVKLHGQENDLFIRLSQDPHFNKIGLQKLLDPIRFIGLAPRQVELFLRDYVEPVRIRYAGKLAKSPDLKV